MLDIGMIGNIGNILQFTSCYYCNRKVIIYIKIIKDYISSEFQNEVIPKTFFKHSGSDNKN